MKFIAIFYLLCILTFSVSNGKFFDMKILKKIYLVFFIAFSYAGQRTHLYDLLRTRLGEKSNSVGLAIKNDKDSSSTSIHNQPLTSYEDEDSVQTRNNWDSGEDYYFQWANLNRRPVEYLTGRKRAVEKVVLLPRDRRINGGLWRSGLVG
jgi:hypothetical protein